MKMKVEEKYEKSVPHSNFVSALQIIFFFLSFFLVAIVRNARISIHANEGRKKKQRVSGERTSIYSFSECAMERGHRHTYTISAKTNETMMKLEKKRHRRMYLRVWLICI